jgi:soluble lytic murein transglycosylase-like protein
MRLVVRSDVRSGKLVRALAVIPRAVSPTVVAPKAATAGGLQAAEAPAAELSGPLHESIERIARVHRLDPKLIHSIIKVESNYNPLAVSPKGALGLMQLVPGTARRFGVGNIFNPLQNIEGGAKYLRYLLDLHDENYALALASYNAGEGAVAQYGGIPPYRETQNYVYLVWKRWSEAKREEEQRRLRATAEPVPPTGAAPPEHNPIREVVDQDGRVMYVSR